MDKSTVTKVCVDDFAFCKRYTYGIDLGPGITYKTIHEHISRKEYTGTIASLRMFMQSNTNIIMA